MSKKYFLQTYGCQMNQRDSERIETILRGLGLSSVEDYKEADVILLNTCSVRQGSENKVYGWGQKIRSIVSERRKPAVILVGCMVGSVRGDRQRYDEVELREKSPWVDYYLAPWEVVEQLPLIIMNENLADNETMERTWTQSKEEQEHAFITISEGCDNFCTYCVVPYARGTEIHRSKEQIMLEIKQRVEQGVNHITLLGQNVNSWGLDDKQKKTIRVGSDDQLPFAQLLRDIHELQGVEKTSFLTANPFDFTNDLVQTLTLPKIDRYLHMAVQSGSDRILEKMNRKHTIDEYKQLIERIRDSVPEVRLGTDIIVGFPTETDEDFEQTMQLLRDIRYEVVYVAMYSPRTGTVAQRDFKDDVTPEVKKIRHQTVLDFIRSTAHS